MAACHCTLVQCLLWDLASLHTLYNNDYHSSWMICVLLEISVLTHTGKVGFHYLEGGEGVFSLAAIFLVGLFQLAVASVPRTAAIAAAAAGCSCLQLYVLRDLMSCGGFPGFALTICPIFHWQGKYSIRSMELYSCVIALRPFGESSWRNFPVIGS